MDRRQLLSAALAGGALALVRDAQAAAAPPTAEATRISDQALRLTWSDKARPATIYAATDSDAPLSAMKKVAAGVKGGAAEAPGPVSPRPYFLIATAAGPVRVAERLLPLKGGRNFRDMGGYRSTDGRQVRWGRLYRSGVMAGLTPADITYLRGLGVKVICDLRNPDERKAAPSPFLDVGGVEVLAVDYKMPGGVNALAQSKTRDEAIKAFSDAYLDFSEVLRPQYTEMFARLVRGDAPLAVNCTAGKDRTGMASALILSALGVPRETVIADYALTEVYSPSAQFLKQMQDPAAAAKNGMPPGQAQTFAAMPPEVLQVMMGSDSAVMRRTLAAIDARYGGPVELAKARFGLTDASVAKLRTMYLA